MNNTYTEKEVIEIINKLEDKIKEQQEEAQQEKKQLISEIERLENKYFNAKHEIERKEFGRKYENTKYDDLEFNTKRDTKVRHKTNGILYELPIVAELDQPLDLVKKEIENDLEHYIKQMQYFYSTWDTAEPNKLSVVNLEIGEITTGYKPDLDKEGNQKLDNKGNPKEKPIKQDAWIATFFYKTNDEEDLVKKRITNEEVQLDVQLDYIGENEGEAWNKAQATKRIYEKMYMNNFQYDLANFKLYCIHYNQNQDSWVATYKLKNFKFKQ